MKEPTVKLKYIIFFLAVATGIFGTGLAIFAYQKFVPDFSFGPEVVADRPELSQKQIENLVQKISKIAILPDSELPSVVVLTDLTKLSTNPFFENASIGDMLIIYKKAGRVMVYNPKAHKIVNIGPYATEQESTASPQLQTPAGASPPPDLQIGPQPPTPEP